MVICVLFEAFDEIKQTNAINEKIDHLTVKFYQQIYN